MYPALVYFARSLNDWFHVGVTHEGTPTGTLMFVTSWFIFSHGGGSGKLEAINGVTTYVALPSVEYVSKGTSFSAVKFLVAS